MLLTPSIAGYREKKRILPVGASATCPKRSEINYIKELFNSYLTYSENNIYIQALEEGPHSEVDIN
jgi:hypothetical protein